jgi:CRP-like cAMP-binding protein
MSNASDAALSGNCLLESLPQADRDFVGRDCEVVDLTLGETICQAGDAIRHVYFPTASFISLIAPVGANQSLEIGMVGDEGIFGATLLLDVKDAPLSGLVQGAGMALQMSAARFTLARDESPAFKTLLNRYLFVVTAQLGQTAVCNRFHSLESRLARWLLMTEDRAHSDTFRLTHQFLAYMLGVRRAGVTEAAGRLQTKNLIRYSRGTLSVLDRRGLESEACDCYDVLKKIYSKHLGKPKARARVATIRKVSAS